MASFKISGMDDLQKDLERLSQNAQRMSGNHKVPFSELFTVSFMRKYTHSLSLDDLLKAGGFQTDLDDIPEHKLDVYIRKVTKFKSWEDMLDTAVEEYIDRQLGF